MKTNSAFWDTSAIVPLCCFQAASAQLRQVYRQHKIVAWWGASIEAHSALRRLQSENVLSATAFAAATKRLDQLKQTWREVLPIERVREIAEQLPHSDNLRALDSMQLAAALVWCREKPFGRLFVCSDAKLTAAAVAHGFSVLP